MTLDRQVARSTPCLRLAVFLAVLLALARAPATGAVADPVPRLVVVLYPQNNDGSPGNFLVDQSIRAALSNGAIEPIEIYNEYLDVAHPTDESGLQPQRDYLRRKYAGRKVDVVIAGLSPALDFALAHRDIFSGAPIVFCAVDDREAQLRDLPSDCIGVPIRFDLDGTLALALRLHADTQHVAVVAGSAPMDLVWENEARSTFRRYEDRVQIHYLTGLSLEDLLARIAGLPEQSVVYYIHVFQDKEGRALVPAHVLEAIARRANAPIYGHVDSYIGRGIVGGHVFSFETEGRNAANLALRILAGESADQIGVQSVSPNAHMFDWRQLRRWKISPGSLPPASVIRYRELGFWDLYRWHVLGVATVCVVQALLIAALLIQRADRVRAEQRFSKAVDAAPNGMLMVSRAGAIVVANSQVEQMFGYRKAEMIGQAVEMLVPERFRSEHAGQRAAFFASPAARTMGAGHALFGRRKDGSEFPVEIGLSPLQADSSQFVLASIIDVTERRQAEDALRASQRQLRELSGSLIGAQENERRRIARELHDDFNQTLALLSIEIDLLRQKPPESIAEFAPRMEELSARVRELSSSIHELSHVLHPLKLEQLGLAASIRGLCNEISQSHALHIEFSSNLATEPVPPDTALCLYRIVQESLRNIVKHSGAKEASVALTGAADAICLRIVDEGAGFDIESLNGKGGLGFISMRERLRLVGGEIAVSSQPSRGTQILVRVPSFSADPERRLQSTFNGV